MKEIWQLHMFHIRALIVFVLYCNATSALIHIK
jgi:hypothetical protein